MMHGGADAYWLRVTAWWAMMAVMMLPVSWPWLAAIARLTTPRGGTAGLPAVTLPGFAIGYLGAWLGFSFVAAALQGLLAPHGSASPALAGGVLAAAGLYQLTPLKSACLERCRSPLSALLSRWPVRAREVVRLGAEHGLFCVGCCWALMLVGLGAGAVGWTWMVAVTAWVAVERLVRSGPRVTRWSGVGLMVLALLAWLGA